MKKVELTFHRNELVFDIREHAYLVARSTSAKSDHPEKDDNWLIDIFQASGQGTGGDEVPTRCMNLAFRECEHWLKQWTAVDVADESTLDDTYGAPTEYTMYMQVEDDTPKVTIQLLKNLIHKFIVLKTLWYWMQLVAPEHADAFAALCDDVENKIKDLTAGVPEDRPLFPYQYG